VRRLNPDSPTFTLIFWRPRAKEVLPPHAPTSRVYQLHFPFYFYFISFSGYFQLKRKENGKTIDTTATPDFSFLMVF
jgi:hypothetical protein